MAGERDFERRLEIIERGVREIEASADAGLRATAQQLVQAILELHAAGLARLLELVHASAENGQATIDRLGADALVGKLLLLHSLHPLPIDSRVLIAIDTLRHTLRSQGAEVELVGVVDDAVRVRVTGTRDVKATVERAILDAAPDATSIDIELIAVPAVVGFVPLSTLRGATAAGVRT